MSCPLREHQLMLTRRQLMGRGTLGVGTAALAGLLPAENLFAAARSAARTEAEWLDCTTRPKPNG